MKLIDLTGKQFGRLVVLSRYGYQGKDILWEASCDCGTRFAVSGAHLRSGHTLSCGCLQRERTREVNGIHGESRPRTPEYEAWNQMRRRCGNPQARGYDNYGGRGVTVCPQWESYSTFLHDVGRRPSRQHSLDRYPDNDGFATKAEAGTAYVHAREGALR